MTICTILLIITLFLIYINADRVQSGLMMEYSFGNQEYAGKSCDSIPNQINPTFSSGIDFGYLELQTAEKNSNSCKVEYSKEANAVVIRAEGDVVSDRWRIKSEKNVTEIMSHLNVDNNGYTMEFWAEFKPVSILELILWVF